MAQRLPRLESRAAPPWWWLVLVVCLWPAGARAEPSALAWLSTTTTPPELEMEVRSATLAHIRALDVEALNPSTPHATLPATVAVAKELTELFELDGVFFALTEDPHSLSIYLYEREGPRLWVQSLDIRGESRQSTVEAVGIVVATAARAMLDGASVGMEPAVIPRAPEPAAEPEPEPGDDARISSDELRRRRRLRTQTRRRQNRSARSQRTNDALARIRRYEDAFATLEVGYVGEHLAPTHAWQSGGRIRGLVTVPGGMSFGLGARALQTARAESGPHTLELRRTPVELALGYRTRLPRGWFLHPEVSGTLDFIRRTARTEADGARAEPPQTTLATAAGARLTAGLTFGARFAAWCAVGLDVWIRRTQYGVAVPSTEVLIEPRLVRPWAGVGFSVSFPPPRPANQ